MAHGFIRGPLDIRLLILYILARVSFPIDEAQLLDLALCDEGVNYFQFTDALASLKNTGHVTESDGGQLSITEKGRANGAICEDELAYSVRLRCDRSIAEVNRKLQRSNQIHASLLPREDGPGVTVHMVMDDDTGNLLTLDMLAPDRRQGELLAAAFRRDAERVYNTLLTTLLGEAGEERE